MSRKILVLGLESLYHINIQCRFSGPFVYDYRYLTVINRIKPVNFGCLSLIINTIDIIDIKELLKKDVLKEF